jgi:hypothetical protein
MSPRSVQRFWDNDMHQTKDLERDPETPIPVFGKNLLN